MPILNTIADRHDEMTAWRHELHANPELDFEEYWTSDFIAEKLTSFGIEVHRGLGGTGVVGIIHGQGDSTKMVGLRADMDALPMQEDNDVEYKSKFDGRMHACGHDGHTAMLLGAAQYLVETRNFNGVVAVIFQPAEEGGGGGKVMIDDGLFEKFNIETIWGMHNWPGVEVGKAVVHHGAVMAAADVFRISITGKGGHAAMPHTTVDTIPAAAAVVQSLQTIVSRRIDPLDPAVVSVTQFHAGRTHNVIADVAEIEGTARYVSAETGKFIQNQIRHIAASVAAAYDCTINFEWLSGYPPTINHADEAGRAAAILNEVMGESSVIFDAPPSMASEDFSYMLDAKPGAYVWLGAGVGKKGGMLHNTGYDFNDALLPIGASYWACLVETELPR